MSNRLLANLSREIRFVSGLFRTLSRVRTVAATSTQLICDDLEAAVDKHVQNIAFEFEGKSVTYGQLDAMANRFAHWATSRGIKRGDTVALFMPNRVEYLAVWYGLSKVGVATALINNQIAGQALAHCLNVSGAAHLICDLETAPAFEAARSQLSRGMTEWVLGAGQVSGSKRGNGQGDRDFDRALKGCSTLRPTRETARFGRPYPCPRQ